MMGPPKRAAGSAGAGARVMVSEVFGTAGRLWSGPVKPTAAGEVGVIRNLKGHAFLFQRVCFNARGDRFVTVDNRGNVYAFYVDGNRYSLVQRTGSRCQVAKFSKLNPQVVVLALADCSVRGYDTDTCSLVFSLKEHAHAVHDLDFSSNGRYAVSASRDRVVLWDTQRWDKLRTMTAKEDPVGCARFFPSSDSLITSFSKRGLLVVWTLPALSIRASLESARSPASPTVLAVSGTGRYVIAGGSSGTVALWEAHVAVLLRTFSLPVGAQELVQAAFLPNSEVVGLLGDDGVVTFVNVLSLRVMLVVALRHLRILSFDLGASGRYLACAASDGTLHLFDLERAFEHRVAQATAERLAGRPAAVTDPALLESVDHVLTGMRAGELGGATDQSSARPAWSVENDAGANQLLATTLGPDAASTSKGGHGQTGGLGAGLSSSSSTSAADGRQRTGASGAAAPSGRPGPEGPRPRWASSRPAGPSWPSGHFSKSTTPHGGRHPADNLFRDTSAGAAPGGRGGGGKDKDDDCDDDVGDDAEGQDRCLCDGVPAADDAPLFRLAHGDPRSHALSDRKLRSLLRAYGAYPAKHRLLVWRFLLRLPENVDAQRALESRGTHPAYANLHERLPLRSGQLLRRLQSTLSQLAHWCPLFGEVEYLPALAFPFVRLFQNDHVASLEVVMTFLLNWTCAWHEFHPNPPVTMMRAVEAVLQAADPQLHAHLEAQGVVVQTFLWSLVRTLMTDVLSRNEWLVLFDHVLSARPSFLCYAAVAYVQYQRLTLLASRTREDFGYFLEHPHPVLMPKLVRATYRLRETTAQPLARALDEACRTASALDPLPEGPTYPMFPSTQYPRFVVDFQAQERARIAEEEKEIERQRANLQALSAKNDELRAKQEAWTKRQEAMLRSEQDRREQWSVEEEARARDRQALEQRVVTQRLEQLKLMERAAVQHMEAQDGFRQAELTRLEDEAARRRRREEQELKARAEREAVEALEFDMQQRLLSLQKEKERAESLEALRREADGEARRREAEVASTKERWLTEDEEARVRIDELRLRHETLLQTNRDARAQRELQRKAAIEELERNATLTQIERERRLRRLAQDELVLREREAEEQRQQAEVLQAEEARIERALLAQEREWTTQRARERAEMLEAKKREAEENLRRRAERLAVVDEDQRRREFQDRLREQRERYAAEALAEEQEIHRVLERLEQEKGADRRLELELQFKEQEMKDKLAFQRVLREAEERVLQEERQRYARLRQELGDRLSKEERALIAAHEEVMARLIVQKERLLWKMNEKWREGVRDSELEGMESDYRAQKDELERTLARFRAEEEALAERVRGLARRTDDNDNADEAAGAAGGASAPAAGAGANDDVDSGAPEAGAAARLSRRHQLPSRLEEYRRQLRREQALPEPRSSSSSSSSHGKLEEETSPSGSRSASAASPAFDYPPASTLTGRPASLRVPPGGDQPEVVARSPAGSLIPPRPPARLGFRHSPVHAGVAGRAPARTAEATRGRAVRAPGSSSVSESVDEYEATFSAQLAPTAGARSASGTTNRPGLVANLSVEDLVARRARVERLRREYQDLYDVDDGGDVDEPEPL